MREKWGDTNTPNTHSSRTTQRERITKKKRIKEKERTPANKRKATLRKIACARAHSTFPSRKLQSAKGSAVSRILTTRAGPKSLRFGAKKRKADQIDPNKHSCNKQQKRTVREGRRVGEKEKRSRQAKARRRCVRRGVTGSARHAT